MVAFADEDKEEDEEAWLREEALLSLRPTPRMLFGSGELPLGPKFPAADDADPVL
jgi:hypothetical protein